MNDKSGSAAQSEVAVDNEKLYADLDEKRFLYRPALRPVFYLFLSETFDGSPSPPVGSPPSVPESPTGHPAANTASAGIRPISASRRSRE